MSVIDEFSHGCEKKDDEEGNPCSGRVGGRDVGVQLQHGDECEVPVRETFFSKFKELASS